MLNNPHALLIIALYTISFCIGNQQVVGWVGSGQKSMSSLRMVQTIPSKELLRPHQGHSPTEAIDFSLVKFDVSSNEEQLNRIAWTNFVV